MPTITISDEISSAIRSQTTNTVLMIEPVAFEYNKATAASNYFQNYVSGAQPKALAEFKAMVSMLKGLGVNVITVKDSLLPHTPDAIFPSNSVSFHDDARAFMYPMHASNRRQEINNDILYTIKNKGFVLKEIFDMRSVADSSYFVEGTGSMVLDHVNCVAYACLSARTDETWVRKTCQRMKYNPVVFTANRDVLWKRLPIHHTNMMMAVAETFVVICLSAIDNEKEREKLLESFMRSNKTVIEITEQQMYNYVGNIIQLNAIKSEMSNVLVMSSRAYDSLTPAQINSIESHCPIAHTDISTIEEVGGNGLGSMMAEVFLPKRQVTKKITVSSVEKS